MRRLLRAMRLIPLGWALMAGLTIGLSFEAVRVVETPVSVMQVPVQQPATPTFTWPTTVPLAP